jgi:hypothetical protein
LALGHANKLSYVSLTNQLTTTTEKRHGQGSNAKQQGKEEAEAGQEKIKGQCTSLLERDKSRPNPQFRSFVDALIHQVACRSLAEAFIHVPAA